MGLTLFCSVEILGKQSLQHLSAQNNLSMDSACDVDSMKMVVVDGRTNCVFDKSCIPPESPFAEGPLANLMIDPDGVTQNTERDISLQLCARCDLSLPVNYHCSYLLCIEPLQ